MINKNFYKIIPLLFGVLLFIFSFDNATAQQIVVCSSAADCSQSYCSAEGLESTPGAIACTGSWVAGTPICSGGICSIYYNCDSSCGTNQGSQTVSSSCVNGFCVNSYSGSCTTNDINPYSSTCGYWEQWPETSAPPEDPNVVGTGGGTVSYCTNPSFFLTSSVYGSEFIIDQGSSGWVGIGASPFNTVTVVDIDGSFSGCPAGATCTKTTADTNTPYPAAPGSVGVTITNTAGTPPGRYPMTFNVVDTSQPTCGQTATVDVVISIPRTVVCDGSYHPIPPGPGLTPQGVASLGPAGVFVDSYFGQPEFIGLTYSALNKLYTQTCRYMSGVGNNCIWGYEFSSTTPNGVNNISRAPYVTASPQPYPYLFTKVRYDSLSNTFTRTGGSFSTFTNEGNTSYPWGTPISTVDTNGRTYNFRKNGSYYEYSCSSNQPDLNVDTLSVIGTLNTGQSLGFRGTVRNTGTASTVASESRLRIDIGNNGSWDVTVSPNQSTGVLAPSGSEIETWNSAWTATAGTHRFEICADTTSVVTESNESNNCSLAGTGVFTVTAPNAIPDINVSPSTINSGQSSTVSWTSTGATSCAVSCNPTGNCSWTGTSGSQSSGALSANKTYTLTCQPGSTTDSATVTVNAASNYTLNVTKSGQGTVTSAPAGVSCGADCNETYPANTTVTLTATPAAGRIFTGWTVQGGGSCSGRGTCDVVMSGNKTVIANFAVDPNYKEF